MMMMVARPMRRHFFNHKFIMRMVRCHVFDYDIMRVMDWYNLFDCMIIFKVAIAMTVVFVVILFDIVIIEISNTFASLVVETFSTDPTLALDDVSKRKNKINE